MREGGGVFFVGQSPATIRNYSAMIGRWFRAALNRPRRGADYLFTGSPCFQEKLMREILRPLAAALGLAAVMALLASSAAFAQAKQAPKQAPAPAAKQAAPPPAPAPMKQIALTEKQIEGVLAASTEMDAITDKIPQNAKPDPKVDAQLEAVAKKNGFASYAEYNEVTDNISMVLAGFDPATKQYVGAEAVLKAQIAAVQADKKMPAKDKKQALADMNEALKTPAPAIENKGNIELVTKYYDKLAAALQDDQ
jgi:hypothetical protein